MMSEEELDELAADIEKNGRGGRVKIIRLTWAEICLGAQAAVMRRVGNMNRSIRPKHGAGQMSDPWDKEIDSCLSEMAVAKAVGMYWSGAIGNFNAADIGPGTQVRSTSRADGRLILHPSDSDDQPFILVRSFTPEFHIVGWIYGREGKIQEHWWGPQNRPDGKAFFVPNEILRDFDDLLSAGIEMREAAE